VHAYVCLHDEYKNAQTQRDSIKLQHTATHCNTLQHNTTRCNTNTQDITSLSSSNFFSKYYKVCYTLHSISLSHTHTHTRCISLAPSLFPVLLCLFQMSKQFPSPLLVLPPLSPPSSQRYTDHRPPSHREVRDRTA